MIDPHVTVGVQNTVIAAAKFLPTGSTTMAQPWRNEQPTAGRRSRGQTVQGLGARGGTTTADGGPPSAQRASRSFTRINSPCLPRSPAGREGLLLNCASLMRTEAQEVAELSKEGDPAWGGTEHTGSQCSKRDPGCLPRRPAGCQLRQCHSRNGKSTSPESSSSTNPTEELGVDLCVAVVLSESSAHEPSQTNKSIVVIHSGTPSKCPEPGPRRGPAAPVTGVFTPRTRGAGSTVFAP